MAFTARKTSVLLVGVAFIVGSSEAFSTTSSSARTTSAATRNSIPVLFSKQENNDQSLIDNNPLSFESSKLPTLGKQQTQKTSTTLAVSLAIAMATASTVLPVLPASAYIDSDYASETVQVAIKGLKSASGNAGDTFKVYESIAAIITEGRGVGGQINYKGVELNRGFVADEDTAIYNPGLTLLTESEKERLVEGVIDCKKAGVKANQWSEENEYAYTFLRTKLDPLHMVELQGLLGIVPYYGAAIYVVVLAVQQFFRDAFQVAYLVGVAAFFFCLS